MIGSTQEAVAENATQLLCEIVCQILQESNICLWEDTSIPLLSSTKPIMLLTTDQAGSNSCGPPKLWSVSRPQRGDPACAAARLVDVGTGIL